MAEESASPLRMEKNENKLKKAASSQMSFSHKNEAGKAFVGNAMQMLRQKKEAKHTAEVELAFQAETMEEANQELTRRIKLMRTEFLSMLTQERNLVESLIEQKLSGSETKLEFKHRTVMNEVYELFNIAVKKATDQ